VRFQSYSAIVDLLTEGDRVTGALAFEAKSDISERIFARAVLLATGGLGRVYRETTNPDVATGDGVAMAWRAGARIENIEFIQFHPTALHVEGAPRFLLSEALRGEGAVLRNRDGEAFMDRYHPMKDLAPRDVVSRSIIAEMQRTGSPHVWLDLTSRDPDFIRRRFPRIYETCLAYGVDISKQPAPVHPAAHYAMGGVRTDLDGRSTLGGLYAAGEVACTGVHGANRLASNSLLEAVVFGMRAGRAMQLESGRIRLRGDAPEAFTPAISEENVRDLAWNHCGIARSREGLERGIQALEEAQADTSRASGLADFELRNMHTVAILIAKCALWREESRGAHYRTDFPVSRPEFQRPSSISRIASATRA
jgi:L-aspartate oxidase